MPYSRRIKLDCEEIFEMLTQQCKQGECQQWTQHYNTILGFIITPERLFPKPARMYRVDFRDIQGQQPSVKKQVPSDARAVFVVADEDFMRIISGKLTLNSALELGLLQVKGDKLVAKKFQREMFPEPTSDNRSKYLANWVTDPKCKL